MKDYEQQFEKKAEAFAGKAVNHPIRTLFLVVIVLGGIGFGISLLSGFFSTVGTVASAPGRVIQKTMDTNNIIQSYEWFYDVDASYKSRYNQISQFKSLLSSETDSSEKSRIRIDLAAIQQTCRDLSTKYNANSEKMNKAVFKGWSLPERLSINSCE